ncbi:MAG TPA: sigma 54-interacting transcriptional regulator [Polyangiaceae bacterium]
MSTREPTAGATQPNAPQSIANQARWWLHFIYPRELEGQSVELAHGLTLGRDPWGDAEASDGNPAIERGVVSHPTVSRRHALVQLGFGGLGAAFLTDLGSHNGTRVDGAPVQQPTPLTPGRVVRLGDALAVVDEAVTASDDGTSTLQGRAASIAKVRQLLVRAAPQPAPVLILGETGTGKEWLAADVHRMSGRGGPHLKLSCAELAPQLIESQLFGHERGAFTGADSRHPGLFVAANGGTLFLDEVGELPLESQAKLLRVLQEGEVRPVGSVRTQRVDVRVVCATNKDLARLVETGAFRRDLHARLSVFELRLPALRERRLDILGWADRFWQRAGGAAGGIQWHPVVAEQLTLHTWSDNLRGVERLVQRLSTYGRSISVGMQLLREVMPEFTADPQPSSPAPSPSAAPATAVRPATPAPATPAPAGPQVQPTRDEFLAVYEALGRNVRAVSKHFGRDRRQIYRWLEAFGIER